MSASSTASCIISDSVGCGKIVALQFGVGRLQRARDRVALDQLGDFGADHVRAEKLAGLGIEHRLDEALRLAERDGLAVADEGELADLDLAARSLWPSLRSCRRIATCGQQ